MNYIKITQSVSRETFQCSTVEGNIVEYTVSQISSLIKGVLEFNFADITVKGEISEITYAKSGHVYFTIKDESAALSVICWRDIFKRLKIKLDIGLEVVCKGKISSYPPRSNYQFILTDIKISGDGTLLKLFQERKDKLEQMGIFDTQHKLQIPKFPDSICVITSESGAVIKDIVQRISSRFPIHVYLYHCQVQGMDAHIQIVNAIQNLNRWKRDAVSNIKPDLIIVARGGGSSQDLWPFNEEELALTIYDSEIPIISAVGHETDFTLCDFAADLRAPTPTAAAEIVVPNRYDIIKHNNHLFGKIKYNTLNCIQINYYKLSASCGIFQKYKHNIEVKISRIENIYKSLSYLINMKIDESTKAVYSLTINPLLKYFNQEITIEQNYLYIKSIVYRKLAHLSSTINSAYRVIDNLNPEKILKKGYAIVRQDNKIISSSTSFKNVENKNITIQFKDGIVKLK